MADWQITKFLFEHNPTNKIDQGTPQKKLKE
jgi:hypothetical protein